MGDTSIRAMDMALELLGVSIYVRNAIRLNNERARQLADTTFKLKKKKNFHRFHRFRNSKDFLAL